MKKILSFILCFIILTSLSSAFTLHSSAIEKKTSLPEFTYPIKSYPTIEDTEIPYDEISSFFPENIEVKYEKEKRVISLGTSGLWARNTISALHAVLSCIGSQKR